MREAKQAACGLAAISKLAQLVLFIFDPSYSSGFSMEAQQRLFKSIQLEFDAANVWLVISKTDLVEAEQYREFAKISPITLAVSRENIAPLREKLVEWVKRQPWQ